MTVTYELHRSQRPPHRRPRGWRRQLKPNWHVDMGAELSEDGVYRYLLWRCRIRGRCRVHDDCRSDDGLATACFRDQLATVTFVMLNPSTADGRVDDATIRKCVAYAELWDYDRLCVVNLYGFRSSSPKALAAAGFPIGAENDRAIVATVQRSLCVVVAWGTHAEPARAKHVLELVHEHMRSEGGPVGAPWTHRPVVALKINQNGSPAHPLYLPLHAEHIDVEPPTPSGDTPETPTPSGDTPETPTQETQCTSSIL